MNTAEADLKARRRGDELDKAALRSLEAALKALEAALGPLEATDAGEGPNADGTRNGESAEEGGATGFFLFLFLWASGRDGGRDGAWGGKRGVARNGNRDRDGSGVGDGHRAGEERDLGVEAEQGWVRGLRNLPGGSDRDNLLRDGRGGLGNSNRDSQLRVRSEVRGVGSGGVRGLRRGDGGVSWGHSGACLTGKETLTQPATRG